ncbi:hypothetical protein E9232_006325 [Inquilinus ginsengisoli]|uniref:Uncharacterized protein n=1 Tax=Inquilinus ginsengisoli TaxID=363840 RepID=A0ABU1JZS1_9PROT|nr:hypothetical protein [Inquilinus ginsengisoli]MDR6293772.1 hypothetical protein [Inquilinus ginsengisoli]
MPYDRFTIRGADPDRCSEGRQRRFLIRGLQVEHEIDIAIPWRVTPGDQRRGERCRVIGCSVFREAGQLRFTGLYRVGVGSSADFVTQLPGSRRDQAKPIGADALDRVGHRVIHLGQPVRPVKEESRDQLLAGGEDAEASTSSGASFLDHVGKVGIADLRNLGHVIAPAWPN